MISPNLEALKTADNLKWDFQAGYQKAIQVFNYSGETTEEYKKACSDLLAQMNTIKADAEFLATAVPKLS